MSGPRKLTDETRARILAKIRHGVHPSVAFQSEGCSRQLLAWVRAQARAGDQHQIEFVDAIQAAEAQCEADAVIATSRAASVQKVPVDCPHCGEAFTADMAALLAINSAVSAQQAKALAAQHAMTRLERRFSKRWSQKVVHTVQEEHERLLDVCQRILAPEVFESLLESYLAEGDSESEAAGGTSGPTTGDVH